MTLCWRPREVNYSVTVHVWDSGKLDKWVTDHAPMHLNIVKTPVTSIMQREQGMVYVLQ